MIHADKLNLAARAVDAQADELTSTIVSSETLQGQNTLRIIAEDLRREAQAGDGYQTRATLALAIVIDNDRAQAETRRRLMMDNLPTDWQDEDAYAEARGSLAEALQAQVEIWAGTEGLRATPQGMIGMASGSQSLPPVASAFVHYALTCVDWHGLADHYLSEHRLSEGL